MPQVPSVQNDNSVFRSRFLSGFGPKGERVPVHVVEFLAPQENAPLIVLLPFTAAHSGQMVGFAQSLTRRGFHCLCLDLPGHGRSGGPRGVYQTEQIFRTIDSVLDAYQQRLPYSPIVLGGSSWGGDLSILYALWEEDRYRSTGQQKRVEAVVAQAVLTPWLRDLFVHFRLGVGMLFEPTGLGKHIAKLLMGERLQVAEMFQLSDLYHRESFRDAFSRDPLRLPAYSTASYFDYLTYMPSVQPDALTIPVHLVIGEQDRLVRLSYEQKIYERFKSMHAQTYLHVVTEGSHALSEEHEGEMVDLFQRLLEATFGFECVTDTSIVATVPKPALTP